ELENGYQRDQRERDGERRVLRRKEMAHQPLYFIAFTAARRSRMRLSRAIFSSSASLLAVWLSALTVPATPVAVTSTRLKALSACSARRVAFGPAMTGPDVPGAAPGADGREAT